MPTGQWKGKHLIDESHAEDLERDAAAHEFGATKLPREKAEEAAHAAYKLKHHGAAIAFHLKNLRKAMNQGRHEDAEKHSEMYSLHMKALGLRKGSMPPDTSQNPSEEDEGPGEFKPHPADQLLVATPKKG